jgi:prepilin-type N-terminal cleavage/methylation domain-containing protein
VRDTARQEGFTLVEVVIGSAVLAILTLVTMSFMGAAQKGYSYSRARTHLEDKTRFVLKEVARELACTGMVCPDWSLAEKKVTYRRCSGYDFDSDVKGWGNRRTFELTGTALHFTEVTDEGAPVFDRVLVEEVEGFSIVQDVENPDLLTIRLDLKGQDCQGNDIPVSRSVMVFLRN